MEKPEKYLLKTHPVNIVQEAHIAEHSVKKIIEMCGTAKTLKYFALVAMDSLIELRKTANEMNK
jgi:hypothetical protein